MNLEELFSKFNFLTIDSLYELISLSKKRDADVLTAIGSQFVNRADEYKDTFEGRNSNDDIDRVNRFDLSELYGKMANLSDEELEVIYNIVNNGYQTIKKRKDVYKNLIPKVQIFFELYSDIKKYKKEVESLNSVPDTPEGKLYKTIFKTISFDEFKEKLKQNRYDTEFTMEELINFFKKYSIIELEALKKIIDLEPDHNNERIMKALDIVYDEKYIKKYKVNNGPKMPMNYNLSRLAKKNEKLSEKELNFLGEIVDDVDVYVNVMDYVASPKEQDEIDKLNISIDEEKKTRVVAKSPKALTKKPKKPKKTP